MWSVGCILGELLGAKAVFAGKDSLHQLRIIVERLGAQGHTWRTPTPCTLHSVHC